MIHIAFPLWASIPKGQTFYNFGRDFHAQYNYVLLSFYAR